VLERDQVACELVREDWEQQFFDSVSNRDAGLIASYQHADYGAFEQPGSFWDFGDLALRLERPPPALGEHTHDVLTELGLSAEEIELCTGNEIAASGRGQHG
jgi:crotonobetainyl-CoA:carnitine CoA-transferase CaiB-like acyl-CoA transferase